MKNLKILKKISSGFTLIELLVVVAIIGKSKQEGATIGAGTACN